MGGDDSGLDEGVELNRIEEKRKGEGHPYINKQVIN